jgi:hypothetical protein
MIRILAAIVLALIFAAGASAQQEEFERYALTPATLEKMNAAGKELKKIGKDKKDSSKSDMGVDDYAKLLDSTPAAKAILAKHGLTSRNFALGTFAVAHAGLFLMMEPSMDKKGRAELLSTYTPETRANIELLRKHGQLLKE